MRKLCLFLACAFSLAAQPSLTAIRDTLYNTDGSRLNGDLIITNDPFAITGVAFVSGNQVTYPIINGVVSLNLVPTDASNPCVAYYVQIVANGGTSQTWWNVPTLLSSVTVASITTTMPCAPVAPATLSWSTLTNTEWTSLTNAQWTSMTN